MIRFATAMLLSALATQALAQSAPSFRSTVLVSGAVVRIGDLVENIPYDKAQIAVFRAPDLGGTGNVPVSRVLEALRPHDVVGVETAGLTEISVTRASRVVGSSEIKDRIAELMAGRLRVSDAHNVAVTPDYPLSAVHLDASSSGPLEIVRFASDPRNGRFDIQFKTDGTPLRITGFAAEAFDAVVAARPLTRGEVLRDGDVAIEKRPKTEFQDDNLRDLASAIGLELRQTMRPGQALRGSDLNKPQLVKRGEPVMLLYEVPGIVLTARGKAEDNGAIGDVVNVTNIQTKRIIQGIVTGPGQVKVTSLTPRITSASANHAALQQGANRP
jgi:flagella basal body P-ring formation protein FlgA